MSYSDVFDYLETEYPDFYRCLDDAGFCQALKKRNNLTLLIPISYMDDLVKKCEDGEDVSQTMLKALILNNYLDNTQKWDQQRDQITNKLNQKVEIQSISKNSVILTNGTIIKPEINIKGSTITLWKVEKGEMPLEGQKIKVNKNPVKSVEDDTQNLRWSIAEKMEEKYDRGNQQAYLDYMSTLVRIVKDEDKHLYNALCFMLDPDPIVSFYMFVEPYKKSNEPFIIPGYILKKCKSKLPNPLRSWKSNFVTPDNASNLQQQIEEITEDVTNDVGKTQLDRVRVAYDDFANGKGIFSSIPEDAAKFYQTRKIKLWQDGARHLIRKAFDNDSTVVRNDTIQEMFSHYVSSIMNTIVTDPKFYKRNNTVVMYESLAGEFIRSNLFMYIPQSPSIEDDTVIAHTWERLENPEQYKEYTDLEDNIIRQLKDLQENDQLRFERIMKEFEPKKANDSSEKMKST